MYLVTDDIAVHGLGEKGTHPLPWNERDHGYIDSHGNVYDEYTMKDVKDFYMIYDVRFLSDLGEDNPDAL